MAFELNSVVPWGSNMEEYRRMFRLDENDMSKKIAGFGDGPACFNCEATNKGSHVVSFDPIMSRAGKRGEMYSMSCRIDCPMSRKVLI